MLEDSKSNILLEETEKYFSLWIWIDTFVSKNF